MDGVDPPDLATLPGSEVVPGLSPQTSRSRVVLPCWNSGGQRNSTSMRYVVGQCGDPYLHCPEDIANHLDHLTHPVP